MNAIPHVPAVHHYTGVTEWTGARGGGTVDYAAYSREYAFAVPGKPVLNGSADVPFRGDHRLHTPEDLLLGALSACHMLSYLALCARTGIVVIGYRDEAEGSMSFADGRLRFTEVVLRPQVRIAAGDAGRALALHAKAHEECFIASSVNFPVRHQPAIERH